MTPQRFDELCLRGEMESSGILAECLDEIARLAAMVYVPGGWHCPKCKFRLVSSVLYAKTGTISVNRQAPDPCPNDGTPMEPDTWQADAKAMAEHMPKAACMDKINQLRKNSTITLLANDGIEPVDGILVFDLNSWSEKRFTSDTLIQALAEAERAKAEISK